jgi:tRNA(Ile)-lysidine synthase
MRPLKGVKDVRNVKDAEGIMEKLLSHLPRLSRRSRVAVAVSGGVDSLALALALKACDADCVALTVDHGLRAESAGEAKTVAKYMRKLEMPHVVLTVKANVTGNKMEWARTQRYALLIDYCKQHKIKTLYVAHHQDDQVETFFLNLERGSGLKGLSGMREVSMMHGIRIIRPLLAFPKSTLAAYVKSHKLKPIEDPTNQNTAYKRNRLRQMMAEAFPDNAELPARIAQAMEHLAEAEDFIADAAHAALAQCVEQNGTLEMDAAAFLSLHNLLQYRVLLSVLRKVSGKPKPPRAENILAALKRMQNNEKAFTLHGVKAALRQKKWRFSKEEKKR